MSDAVSRPVSDLSDDERSQLEAAHRELREAIAAYEQFVAGPLPATGQMPVLDREAMAEAQAAVERAEARLWHLREELLGWARPPWAPGAALTADWFSEEDAVYDDLAEGSPS